MPTLDPSYSSQTLDNQVVCPHGQYARVDQGIVRHRWTLIEAQRVHLKHTVHLCKDNPSRIRNRFLRKASEQKLMDSIIIHRVVGSSSTSSSWGWRWEVIYLHCRRRKTCECSVKRRTVRPCCRYGASKASVAFVACALPLCIRQSWPRPWRDCSAAWQRPGACTHSNGVEGTTDLSRYDVGQHTHHSAAAISCNSSLWGLPKVQSLGGITASAVSQNLCHSFSKTLKYAFSLCQDCHCPQSSSQSPTYNCTCLFSQQLLLSTAGSNCINA